MRIFATSDLHVDYEANARWLQGISEADFRDDYVIVAGDISHSFSQVETALELFTRRFRQVFYVPGNHDLWLRKESNFRHSIDKFDALMSLAADLGVHTSYYREDGLSIVPLLGWYDYSFGRPGSILSSAWADYRQCRWPDGQDDATVTDGFLNRNKPVIEAARSAEPGYRISFSHFLPRIDVMSHRIPDRKRYVYPVLGTQRLDGQVRQLGSALHVYGHSHVNRNVTIDGITYINNAFGYPSETRIAAKRLVSVFQQ
jgi:predicted phosphodiesterase